MRSKKNLQKRKGPTTARNLIARFEAGKSVLDYFDTTKGFHPNWGGARSGAGRKSMGSVRLQLSLPAAVAARIRDLARRQK